MHRAVRIEDLRHADFSADDSSDHIYVRVGFGLLASGFGRCRAR
jgi:hypothetical protein